MGKSLDAQMRVSLVDDVTKPARSVAQALKDAEKAAKDVAKGMAGTGATDKFAASLSKLKLSAKDIQQVARAWQDYARSAGLAANSANWTKAQIASVRAWEAQTVRSLRQVAREQQQYNRKTIEQAKKADEHRMTPGKALRSGATYLVDEKAKDAVKNVVEKTREADDTVRYQGAMADLTPEEMASRQRQAIKLGPATGLKPNDILHAQQKLAGRGVDKRFVEPFTEELTNYARAMNTKLADAANTLESIIFSTGQNVEDAATASKVMRRQIDIAVKASKLGGMDDADVAAAAKFGGSASHAAGFKNETFWAIVAALKKAGYEGSEAGVAARGISSKLVSPTAKGLDALAAMGVNYNQFTKMPGGMNPNNLEGMSKRRFGKRFSPDQINRLQSVFDNPEVVGDRDKFVSEVSGIIAASFEKNKKGKTRAQDAQKIAKLAGDFYKMSIESVDVEGLLRAIMEKHPSLQLLNALFTSEHGSKVGAMAEHLERFNQIVEAINNVHEGFAKQIGDLRMDGVAGSMNKAEAAAEALALRFGEANAAIIKFVADLQADAAKKVADTPNSVLQGGTVLGGGLLTGLTIGAIKQWLGGATIKEIIGGGFGAVGGGIKAIARNYPALAAILGIPTIAAAGAEKGEMRGAVPGNRPLLREKGAPGFPSKDRVALPLPDEENLASAGQAKADQERYSKPPQIKGYIDGKQVVGPEVDAAKKSVDSIHHTLQLLNGEQITPHIDTLQLDQGKEKAGEMRKSLLDINGTFSPKVDTSSIDAALAKVARLKGELAGIGSGAGLGSFGRAFRNSFVTGPQGE